MTTAAGQAVGYPEWNAAVVRYLFREELAGRRVFFFISEDDLGKIAAELGSSAEAFFEAVRGGPPGDPRAAQVARRAVALKDSWRHRSQVEGLPPYAAYLALFVVAAGTDDEDIPEQAYYPRLRRLLGLPEQGGALPEFHKLLDVWHDLEKWSIEDMDERLGTFRFQVVGQRHIGVPRAQTLLTEAELDSLPEVFAAAQLDPTTEPTDLALSQALERAGRELRRRTRRVLAGRSDEPLRVALLDAVRAELAEWDGEISSDGAGDRGRGMVFGGLRLCLEPQRLRWFASLRCTLNRDYPTDPMTLASRDGPRFVCQELAPPWSKRLQLEEEQTTFDASGLDWCEPMELRDVERGWRFQMRGRCVRVFEEGESYGLPGLVEAFRLERAKPLYLASSPEHEDAIRRWGQQGASGFAEVIAPGVLSPGWRLFRAAEAHDDAELRSIEPSLAFLGHLGLRLVGGVRVGRGAGYLGFAPPAVAVDGGDGRESVQCAGCTLRASRPGLYPLPADAPRGEHLVIELIKDGEVMRRLALLLRDEVAWTGATPLRVDGFGDPVAQGRPGICGAYVSEQVCHLARRFRPPVATPWPTAVLVGAAPGQVSEWPKEPLPRDWLPVWAIGPPAPGRRRRPLAFVGSSVASSKPQPARRDVKRRLGKRWREVTWHWRKQVEPPPSPALAALWEDYLGAARK
jgi:hypothetical protein